MSDDTNFDTPEFLLPFQFTADGAALCEQGSDTELQQSAFTILAYEKGERADLPEFGLPDQVFTEGGANLQTIVSVLNRWDDRLSEVISRDPNWLQTMADTISVRRNSNG